MASVIRPTVNVFDATNKVCGEVPMQAVFKVAIRPSLIESVHTKVNKNHRQPYAVSSKAGHQTSAVSWGTGRALARIPRVSGGGTHRAGQAAFGNMCRGGRMFAPTKIWRKWHVKTNVNEKRYATCSAIAATAVAPLVLARGHRIERINEVPFVVSSDIEKFTKTKEAVKALKSLRAYPDVQRVIDSKTIRAGKGKLRNRRYRQRRGPLIIFNKDEGIRRAFRNIPGIELCNVQRLNLLQLAPGGHLGRFVIWTQDAFAALDKIYGTFTEASSKKNFILPTPIISNPDIKRLINSEEIRAVSRKSKRVPRKKSVKGNPLKNAGLRLKLNPYSATLRSQEISYAKKLAQLKAEGKSLKQYKLEQQKAKKKPLTDEQKAVVAKRIARRKAKKEAATKKSE